MKFRIILIIFGILLLLPPVFALEEDSIYILSVKPKSTGFWLSEFTEGEFLRYEIKIKNIGKRQINTSELIWRVETPISTFYQRGVYIGDILPNETKTVLSDKFEASSIGYYNLKFRNFIGNGKTIEIQPNPGDETIWDTTRIKESPFNLPFWISMSAVAISILGLYFNYLKKGGIKVIFSPPLFFSKIDNTVELIFPLLFTNTGVNQKTISEIQLTVKKGRKKNMLEHPTLHKTFPPKIHPESSVVNIMLDEEMLSAFSVKESEEKTMGFHCKFDEIFLKSGNYEFILEFKVNGTKKKSFIIYKLNLKKKFIDTMKSKNATGAYLK